MSDPEHSAEDNDEQMTCETICELLYLFATDELSEKEAGEVATHLARCASCRTAMAETVKLTGLLAGAMRNTPPRLFYSD